MQAWLTRHFAVSKVDIVIVMTVVQACDTGCDAGVGGGVIRAGHAAGHGYVGAAAIVVVIMVAESPASTQVNYN